ncbi:FAD-dependent monooxygenase, partial [Streptomyces sp. NPDC049577]|uniref:FAD-dependent monooxygenase n=1 Tax=Streptomyces sp. NPDC049577 TaxID=3155153 RepID=UPI00341C836A
PRPLAIEQQDIERLLRERLRQLGTDVQWATEAVAVRTCDDGAEVDVRGPGHRLRTVGCRWLVGCEGAHSLVRRTLGVPFEGERRFDLQALQINAQADWRYPYLPDLVYFFLDHRATVMASPRPGGGYRFFAFCTDPDPLLEAPPGLDEMRTLVARVARDDGTRLVPTSPPWTNRSRFHDRMAASLRRGRVLLAGDSAHLWAPIGGHGLNTGLRGAHNLGWKLAAVHRGWAVEALLDTYNTEQRHTAGQVMREMRRNVLELPPGRATLAGMRLLLPALLSSERVARRGRGLLSDFARHHGESELSSGFARHGLHAGDRLPDLPVTAQRGPCHLHDLLSYDRWTLLLVPEEDGKGETAETARLRALIDRHAVPVELFRVRPQARARGGLSPGSLLLVRPDGHIGLLARANDQHALHAYLSRWFTPGR